MHKALLRFNGGFTMCAALSLSVGSCPHRGSCLPGRPRCRANRHGLPTKQLKAGYETG
jgi:hypothetical protein